VTVTKNIPFPENFYLSVTESNGHKDIVQVLTYTIINIFKPS